MDAALWVAVIALAAVFIPSGFVHAVRGRRRSVELGQEWALCGWVSAAVAGVAVRMMTGGRKSNGSYGSTGAPPS